VATVVAAEADDDLFIGATERLASIVETPRDLENILLRLQPAVWRPLVRLAEALGALDRRGGFKMPGAEPSRPRSSGAGSWIARYPKKLHAAIGRLSAQKLERLREKLERRVLLARVKAWASALRAELCDRLERQLGGVVPPGWSEDAGTLRLIAHLLALSGRARRVALRILGARRGDPPWDPRDAAANRRFLDGLGRRGIDMTPWVDGIGAVEFVATDGGPPRQVEGRRRDSDRVLSLELEDDPLEVFLMGERFHTCLSVGDDNFFSVVANAADINKRVVHARDSRGAFWGAVSWR